MAKNSLNLGKQNTTDSRSPVTTKQVKPKEIIPTYIKTWKQPDINDALPTGNTNLNDSGLLSRNYEGWKEVEQELPSTKKRSDQEFYIQ